MDGKRIWLWLKHDAYSMKYQFYPKNVCNMDFQAQPGYDSAMRPAARTADGHGRRMDMKRARDSTRPAAGAQAIDRACALLKEIARNGMAGVRLVDLTASSGLTRPTVHRMLQSLSAADFVRQDPTTKRYKLGAAIYGLALAAPSPLDSLAELRPLLDELAARTGDAAYLMLRRGDEVQCLARAEGSAPIRTYLIDVGALRPIGTTIAGIAMIAPLSDDEVDAILLRTAAAMRQYRNATPEYVRREIDFTRQHGYCVSEGIFIKGATGISAAVPRADGAPFLAISLSAISSRVPKSRVRPLADDLLRTCAKMAQILARAARTPVPAVAHRPTAGGRHTAGRPAHAGGGRRTPAR